MIPGVPELRAGREAIDRSQEIGKAQLTLRPSTTNPQPVKIKEVAP